MAPYNTVMAIVRMHEASSIRARESEVEVGTEFEDLWDNIACTTSSIRQTRLPCGRRCIAVDTRNGVIRILSQAPPHQWASDL